MSAEASSSHVLQAGRIQRLIADMQAAVQTHGRTVHKLNRRDEALQKRAQTAVEQAREELQQQFEHEKETIRTAYKQAVEHLNQHYDQWQQRRHAAFESVRKQVVAAGTAEEEQATQAYQQRVWSSGSGLNAVREKAVAERDRDLKRLAELEAELQAVRKQGRGLARLARLRLPEPAPAPEVGLEDDEEIERALAALAEDVERLREETAAARLAVGPASSTFRVLPAVLLVLAVIHISLAFLLPRLVAVPDWAATVLLFSPLIWLLSPLVVIAVARRHIGPVIEQLRQRLDPTAPVAAATRVQIQDRYARWLNEAEGAHDQEEEQAEKELNDLLARLRQEIADHIAALKTRNQRLEDRIEDRRRAALVASDRHCQQQRDEAEAREPGALQNLEQEHEEQLATLRQEQVDAWQNLQTEWTTEMGHLYAELKQVQGAADALFPAWDEVDFQAWQPPSDFPPAVPFGTLRVDLGAAGPLPAAEQLALPGEAEFELPAVMNFPHACNLLLESAAGGRDEALATLQSVMLRLLTGLPPGKVSFTIIDPIGLGESFAGFMHLADYDERFVGRRIWVEPRHIEQQLADLNEHMEKVIQKYLRNEFESIAEFNERAGEMAERYRFVVICDFPANFSETAAQRLASVVTSGARCGVFVLMHKDRREAPPGGFDMALLRQHSTWLSYEADGGYQWKSDRAPEAALVLTPPPAGARLTQGLQRIGESLADASRVEVPFHEISPDREAIWSRSSASELRVPIGKAGAHKLQELVFGKGTSQHALVAGKTGSGKSTLFHVVITSLSLWYSPDEVEFYLIDFKKGVEFKCYARGQLPHIRAVAIESDREFGLSILHRVDQELKERGERFRQQDVQDIAGYRQLADHEVTPRTVLLIDEFQELFVADDRISQEAALLLDRIVRQGRAFGIHVILGSQTLGGAYSLPRTTMGQMAVRIALQCSEADSYMILNDDNAAARLLSRPGEAIYNDSAGLVEGNSPFQVTWLPDRERDAWLDKIRQLAEERECQMPSAIVFEGNAPARLEDNQALRKQMAGEGPDEPHLRLWLGEPNVIKAPTHLDLRRLTGANVLVVGQSSEQARSLIATMLISLLAQGTAPEDRVYFLDGSLPDSPQAGYFPQLCEQVGALVTLNTYRETPEVVAELHRELQARGELDDMPGRRVLIVFGLQRFKQLRQSDDFGFSFDEAEKGGAADKQFAELLADGPESRLHTIVWCDSLNNVNRTLSRQLLGEFDYRILFQMSANDSTTLIDTPEASKLGLHWALLYNDQKGSFEKFRPYALPSLDHPFCRAD